MAKFSLTVNKKDNNTVLEINGNHELSGVFETSKDSTVIIIKRKKEEIKEHD